MLENFAKFFKRGSQPESTKPVEQRPHHNPVRDQLLSDQPLSGERGAILDSVRFLLGNANAHEDMLLSLPMNQRRDVLKKIVDYLETNSEELTQLESIQMLRAIHSVGGDLFWRTGAEFKNQKLVLNWDFLRNGKFRRLTQDRLVAITQKVLDGLLDMDTSSLVEEWAGRRFSYTGLTLPHTKLPAYMRRIIGFQSNIYYFLEVRDRVKDFGDVKTFITEFGIENFSRYGPSALAHMGKSMSDTESEFVTVISGGDWNGAFHDFRDIDQNLREVFTDDDGNSLPIRYTEAHTRREGMKVMRNLRRRFHTEGEVGKAQVVLVGYHGEPELMEMQASKTGDSHLVTVKDMEWFVRRGYAECLAPGATIILDSCSTGAEGGIGQRLSEMLHVRVIGPDRPSGVGKMSKGEAGEVKVSYGLGAKTMVYENGQLVDTYGEVEKKK